MQTRSRNKPALPFLNRYTSLPILLDMLSNKQLVLLSPSSWEDRNDSYYLERYKEEKVLATVLALCFTKKRETFHHWKIFSDGIAGVCVEFDKAKLIGAIADLEGYRSGNVVYRYIKEMENDRPKVGRWPFLKRKPFKDEGEFRIVYQNKHTKFPTKNISIKIDWIRKVTLSPWMPSSVAKTVKSIICGINGCERLRVNHSSLLETTAWKAIINRANAEFQGDVARHKAPFYSRA